MTTPACRPLRGIASSLIPCAHSNTHAPATRSEDFPPPAAAGRATAGAGAFAAACAGLGRDRRWRVIATPGLLLLGHFPHAHTSIPSRRAELVAWVWRRREALHGRLLTGSGAESAAGGRERERWADGGGRRPCKAQVSIHRAPAPPPPPLHRTGGFWSCWRRCSLQSTVAEVDTTSEGCVEMGGAPTAGPGAAPRGDAANEVTRGD